MVLLFFRTTPDYIEVICFHVSDIRGHLLVVSLREFNFSQSCVIHPLFTDTTVEGLVSNHGFASGTTNIARMNQTLARTS